jgi:hypothetical protein
MKQLETLKMCDKEQIYIIVSDNHSTQEEYLNVERFCNSLSNFRYHKNCSNLSANPNILNGFLYCNLAEYLWILSDDDLLKKDAVEKVIDTLTQYNPDLLYIVQNPGQAHLLQVNQEWLTTHIKDGMGLISLVIYRTSYIQESIRVGYENLLSCFPHMAILFESTKGRTAQLCRLSRDEVFHPHNPLPVANSIWYKYSFFGFTHLVNNLENELQRPFINSWWHKNWFRVPGEIKFAPIHFAICRSLLFRHINYFEIQWFALMLLKPVIRLAFYFKSSFRNSQAKKNSNSKV